MKDKQTFYFLVAINVHNISLISEATSFDPLELYAKWLDHPAGLAVFGSHE